jgi:GMP synthase-like glutamine amidotransferase
VRALLIQHDHICTPGFVGERLLDRGLDLVVHQVVREDRFLSPNVEIEFPDPTDFDAIIPMGAPWSVYDHEAIGTWVPAELTMLRDAHHHEVPVLGICFGGQMLAAAHGGSVARSAAPEIGWVNVDSDDESLVPSGTWFQLALRPVAAAQTRTGSGAQRQLVTGFPPRPKSCGAVSSRNDLRDSRFLDRNWRCLGS